MDLGLIVGVTGTLATIVFGVLSVDLFRRRKYPGKITYVKNSIVDLLNSVARNFEDIKLLHGDLAVNKSLVYIKASLINNGDIDINAKQIATDISISLPKTCHWISIKTTKSSSGLNPHAIILEPSKAAIKFDLFRKDEFIQFEGIIEGETDSDCADAVDSQIRIEHRIENVAKVEKKVLLSLKEIKKRKSKAISFAAMLAVIIILLPATIIFDGFGEKSPPIYYRETPDSKGYFYEASRSGDSIKIEAKNAEITKIISYDDFNVKFNATHDTLNFIQMLKENMLMLIIQIVLFSIVIGFEMKDVRSAKRIARIIDEKDLK